MTKRQFISLDFKHPDGIMCTLYDDRKIVCQAITPNVEYPHAKVIEALDDLRRAHLK